MSESMNPGMGSKGGRQYLETLCLYYEEEIQGEGYFLALAERMAVGDAERRKLQLLAEVERHAARAVEPLLGKHALAPRPERELLLEGRTSAARHAAMSWREFMTYIVDRYPGYLDEFAALEAMAPAADLAELETLTAHEVAAIEFARLELAGDAASSAPLVDYLGRPREVMPCST